ncbi:unnamed protein product [Soboliphyme baturini]|uniref:Ras-GAP domain-containing protein n=1 Tax=Soboliphyme baturini TaxID=241478 RepID=A0A183J1F5_9BILA|nr:unnamed protein product [Soboliphyme baturini]
MCCNHSFEEQGEIKCHRLSSRTSCNRLLRSWVISHRVVAVHHLGVQDFVDATHTSHSSVALRLVAFRSEPEPVFFRLSEATKNWKKPMAERTAVTTAGDDRTLRLMDGRTYVRKGDRCRGQTGLALFCLRRRLATSLTDGRRQADRLRETHADVYPPLQFNQPANPSCQLFAIDASLFVSITDVDVVALCTILLVYRVLDYCDLSLTSTRSTDLYALITVQNVHSSDYQGTKKMRIRRKSFSSGIVSPVGAISLDLNRLNVNDDGARDAAATSGEDFSTGCLMDSSSSSYFPVVRLSIWQDMLRSFSSYFHGEVLIPLTKEIMNSHRHVAWYYLKPRNSQTESDFLDETSKQSEPVHQSKQGEEYGSLRLRIAYSVDHILRGQFYNELWSLLLDSFKVEPFRCSAVEVFPHLPKAEDVNTLFRSSSFTTRCVFELMKLVGQQYLIGTLKPCIDKIACTFKIFVENKPCEVDPEKIAEGQSLEENTRNLIIYAEMTLSRIVDSNHRCPQLLKEVFKILRETTAKFFPSETLLRC